MSVAEQNWTAWLDPNLHDVDQVRALMAPPEPGTLLSYPVTKAVGNVRSNGPRLVEPVDI